MDLTAGATHRSPSSAHLVLSRAEQTAATAHRATAELWAALAELLAEARRLPEVFVDPRLPLSGRERAEFAERAAAADAAVRLGLSETSVRGRAFDAVTLRERVPAFWRRCLAGQVQPAAAQYAAELARSLPQDPATWRRFDESLGELIGLPVGRFRSRARVARERAHPTSLHERTRRAREQRAVWLEPGLDGMACLSLALPADQAHRAFARIDAAARGLGLDATDARTLSQLRADVAADLLISGEVKGVPAVQVSVAVTVPVLALLGRSEEPATLEGYGPIDAQTARELAAGASSFVRILTHPVSSTVLDIDRRTYRVPADLRRWARFAQRSCRFPGCGRGARGCDLDHIDDYARGGETRGSNLAVLCRHHHRLKHQTRWQVQPPDQPGGTLRWTSPTGAEHRTVPPPF